MTATSSRLARSNGAISDGRSIQLEKEDTMNAQRIVGRVALVTGANRGIGRALTEARDTEGVAA
jgi:hypothetical protein